MLTLLSGGMDSRLRGNDVLLLSLPYIRFRRSADQSPSTEMIATAVMPRSLAWALMVSRLMSVASRPTLFVTPSFPRRREPMLTLRSGGMDSRLRGNDVLLLRLLYIRFRRSADQSPSTEMIATAVMPRSLAWALMVSRLMSVAFDAVCFR
jgi:hypothetical protein